MLIDPAFAVLRFELQLAFIHATSVPRGIAEWLVRVDRIRWMLAIGDFAHLKMGLAVHPDQRTTCTQRLTVGEGLLPSDSLARRDAQQCSVPHL